MKPKEILREARKQILLSYGHKLILFGVACLGFLSLDRLIEKKDIFDNQRKEEWQVDHSVQEVLLAARPFEVKEPLAAKSACRVPGKEKTYATRADLISAMQDRAAACVWETFHANVQDVRSKMKDIRGKAAISKEELEAYMLYAGFIEKERAYAATRAAAAQQYVGTMLMGENAKAGSPPSSESWREKLFDETKGGYVIYQILWYASLLLGVGAASMLVIVILTALPITNAEGYWTKRIEEILDRFPSTSGRTLATPLLMAAIGGGTLLGTALETEAGGQARFPYDTPPSIEVSHCIDTPVCVKPPTGLPLAGDPPLPNPTSGTGDWTFAPYHAGNIYNFPPLEQGGSEEIAKGLEAIRRQTEDVAAKTKAVREELAAQAEATRRATGTKIDEVTTAVRSVERGVNSFEDTVDLAKKEAMNTFENLGEKVDDVDRKLAKHVEITEKTATGVEGREEAQATLSTQTLAQIAETDQRNAFARTFLWTLYKVGPAVHKTMESRLMSLKPSQESPLTLEEQAFLKAISDMRKEEPLRRGPFEKLLRDKLMNQLPKEQKDQADLLLENHFPSLLHLCALSRR